MSIVLHIYACLAKAPLPPHMNPGLNEGKFIHTATNSINSEINNHASL